MLWLGEVSFALYLIHEPILYYLIYSVRGKATWGTVDNEEDDFDPEVEAHQLPGWLIPVHVALSLLAAAGLYYHFELPVSNWLRPAKSSPAGGAARGGALPPTETQVVVQKGSYLEGYGSTHSSTTGGQ
jgi:peptidoglycan/LPS O-acetylase OafA/YrhL